MATASEFLTVIFASGLLSAKTCVDGSIPSCPKAAVVDLTNGTTDSSGCLNESGDVFPKETTWVKNGRIFGCPCLFKNCIRLCCPVENPVNSEDCIEDEDTFRLSLTEKYDRKNAHLFIDEPCSKNFTLFERFSKILMDYEPPKDGSAPHYPKLKEWILVNVVREYVDRENYGMLTWCLGCLNVSMLFELATLVVYSVIPDLKNLQGSIFRCYLVSYISCVFLFEILLFRVDPATDLNMGKADFVTSAIAGGFVYSGISTTLWMKMMSFDVWRTFRKFRPVRDVNSVDEKKRKARRFLLYSIYAWGNSLLCMIILELLISVSALENVWKYAAGLWIGTVSIFNTSMYILTALAIKKSKQEIAYLVDGANNHHQESEQWFNLYLKLFIITGGPIIFHALGICLKIRTFFWIVYTLEGLQGISVFFIFVWKDKIKRSFRKEFDRMVLALRSFLRPGSTSETGN